MYCRDSLYVRGEIERHYKTHEILHKYKYQSVVSIHILKLLKLRPQHLLVVSSNLLYFTTTVRHLHSVFRLLVFTDEIETAVP